MYPGRHEPRGAWVEKFSYFPNLFLVENGANLGEPQSKTEITTALYIRVSFNKLHITYTIYFLFKRFLEKHLLLE